MGACWVADLVYEEAASSVGQSGCAQVASRVAWSAARTGGTEAADWAMQRAAPMDSTTAARKVYRTVDWMVVCWTAHSVGMLAELSVDVKVEMMAARRGDWLAGRMDSCSAALKAFKSVAMWVSAQAVEKVNTSRAAV